MHTQILPYYLYYMQLPKYEEMHGIKLQGTNGRHQRILFVLQMSILD